MNTLAVALIAEGLGKKLAYKQLFKELLSKKLLPIAKKTGFGVPKPVFLLLAEFTIGVGAHIVFVYGEGSSSTTAANCFKSADSAGTVKLGLFTHINQDLTGFIYFC